MVYELATFQALRDGLRCKDIWVVGAGPCQGPGPLDLSNYLCHHFSMVIDKEGRTPIVFRLDPGSGVPTYQQIVRQVEHALRLGYLAPGDRLPTVKDIVGALAINPNTVLKAYRELEHKGLVAGRPGQGTFVEAALEVVPLRDQQALQKGLSRWLETALEAGLDSEGITALFTSALHDRLQHQPLGKARPERGPGQSEAAS
jgi:GntR family transcriptional regulator